MFGPQRAPACGAGGRGGGESRVTLPPKFIFPFVEKLDSCADSAAAPGHAEGRCYPGFL